ncbi:MAG: hypothetical protein A3C70_01995 [Candidatus Zambryskibacteria bacterium RIFCSPHIGHO2_02_FULL_43_14]|uniref:Uncharacterized protein n=1 Tax=Candidatus Zambryskibacteria bacterium RIFCSPHIGHO2_02_FULL_43_14 TaxID=1802748 RepID=A0A1G2THH4_9BACT|nr:MAG: hypothetical protein A2829_01670 [Candidatus Zambryskibacteria bacterium RIFCSPHIGHO2_01_FULL_43_60]OHA96653.1 MAG: hypothetical protein A3C70_01995 [Candidatus Zambryskibacteria bacterium RIFCSPHIGHO2_02_FULL_43_14]OHB04005.1 MAG: hypothetical protein A3B03_00915 [Candidatus Zambryskibacteria bacterium RIFCSPLOWO2_01_FULL_42_41]
MTVFVELSLILVLATAVSLVVKFLKQPLIVGYIAVGILVGPYALDILQAREEIELFSKIGVSILLFIIGLTLNPDVMREVGRTSVITGLGQILFTSLIGFFIVRALGLGTINSLYVAVALTFSSTIIISKLLSDRGDIQKLYGKISIGFLLVQDIVAVILLLGVSVMGAAATNAINFSFTTALEIFILIGKGTIIVALLYLISKHVLPRISAFVAEQQEILFIFSLAWGLGLSSLFYVLGFSIEIGALIAGITLAVSPFAYEIASRLKPLRDFFIMLFFVLLGSQLVVNQISLLLIPALVLSIFVLVGNPLIVLLLMNILGYRTRTAFMAGLTVAQISEFSLILATLGYYFGHISQEVVSLITLVGIITIAVSTYLILYADYVYLWLKPILVFLILRRSTMPVQDLNNNCTDVIIFGYDRVGFEFVKAAQKITASYLVVDFSPRSIARLKEWRIPYRYGDAEDIEFLQEINFTKAKLIISTIPELKTNLLLINHYRNHNPTGIAIVISHDIEQAKKLYAAGASYVVIPHHLGAHHAASLIETHSFDSKAFELEKDRHWRNLLEREKGYVKEKQ